MVVILERKNGRVSEWWISKNDDPILAAADLRHVYPWDDEPTEDGLYMCVGYTKLVAMGDSIHNEWLQHHSDNPNANEINFKQALAHSCVQSHLTSLHTYVPASR